MDRTAPSNFSVKNILEVNDWQLLQMNLPWPKKLALSAGQERRVWIWLPPGYEKSSDDYSVLFMHDGQNVFRDEDATFGTCWGMIDAQLQLEEPMIVVAIEGQNNGLQRFNEFSPWLNSDLDYWKSSPGLEAGGDADAYLNFVVDTIVPMVHHRFRCRRNPEHNILGGSSMGGFVSLYAATRFESVFGKFMAMSTATWFAQESLLECLKTHDFKKITCIYVDIGTCETSNDQIVEFPAIYLSGNEKLFQLLQVSLTSNQFLSKICRGDIHNEAAWAKRLPGALRWLNAKKCEVDHIK